MFSQLENNISVICGSLHEVDFFTAVETNKLLKKHKAMKNIVREFSSNFSKAMFSL